MGGVWEQNKDWNAKPIDREYCVIFASHENDVHMTSLDTIIQQMKIDILPMLATETNFVDILNELKEYDIDVVSCDPIAPKDEVKRFYGVTLTDLKDIKDCDAVVMAVAHKEYAAMTMNDLRVLFKPEIAQKLVYDVKGVISREDVPSDMVLKRL